MAVKLAAAHIDERGSARGGSAGDQTGREVCVRDYYVHSKGWRVFRSIDAEAGKKIARDAEAACSNKCIGYDQDQRDTLYDVAKPVGFDCAKVKKPCETDCSALVRVCCAYAGIMLPNFNTASEASVLEKSGAFRELTGSQYTASGRRLRRGDILVTRTKGHTEIVISDGPDAEAAPAAPIQLGERTLKVGMSGDDVKALQEALIALDYSCGPDGADGDFGTNTQKAVKAFQRAHLCEVDGVVGPETLDAIRRAQAAASAYSKVIVTAHCVNVRKGPGMDHDVLGVVRKGTALPYQGQTFDNGWHLIEYEGENAAISGKYTRLEQ